MLKVELHAHTCDDPVDNIPHTAEQLIDRAVELGYGALAITLHDRQLESPNLSAYAREKGLVLVPGVERTVCGKHVLLINFPCVAEQVQSFEAIARLKERYGGLVIAPHPFFPTATCLRRLMDPLAEIFDAVELNHFYTSTVNFNRAALRWAAKHGKTVVGNSDVHFLVQLGRTFTLVDAAPDAASICDAIRAGKVQVRSEPLSWSQVGSIVGRMLHGWLAAKTRFGEQAVSNPYEGRQA